MERKNVVLVFYDEVKKVFECPNLVLEKIRVSPDFLEEVIDFDALVGTKTFRRVPGSENLFLEDTDILVEEDPFIEEDALYGLKMSITAETYECYCSKCESILEEYDNYFADEDEDKEEIPFSCSCCDEPYEDMLDSIFLDEFDEEPEEIVEVSLYAEETGDFICTVAMDQDTVDAIFEKGFISVLEEYIEDNK